MPAFFEAFRCLLYLIFTKASHAPEAEEYCRSCWLLIKPLHESVQLTVPPLGSMAKHSLAGSALLNQYTRQDLARDRDPEPWYIQLSLRISEIGDIHSVFIPESLEMEHDGEKAAVGSIEYVGRNAELGCNINQGRAEEV
ncbi:hypothetical protein AKJ16_DCAP26167 [Drosera capensis]